MMINCTSRRGAVHEILDAVNADFAPAFTFGLPIHDSIIAKAGRDADRVSEIMVIVSKGNLQTAAPSAGRRWPSRPSSGYAGNDPAMIRQFVKYSICSGSCQEGSARSLAGGCPACLASARLPGSGRQLRLAVNRLIIRRIDPTCNR